MPKNKPTKGLLKRIRITGTGRVKLQRAGGRHRRSHKSGTRLRDYRRPKYAHASDVRRMQSMLFRRLSRRAGGSRPSTSSD